MEISSCNPSGTYNFEAVPRFLENISTPDLIIGSYFAHSCTKNNIFHKEQHKHDFSISSLL